MKFAQYKLILQLGQRKNLSFLSVENWDWTIIIENASMPFYDDFI